MSIWKNFLNTRNYAHFHFFFKISRMLRIFIKSNHSFFPLNITQCWRKHQRPTQETSTRLSLSKQIRGIWLVCNISPIIKVFCKCRRKISNNIKWKYRFFLKVTHTKEWRVTHVWHKINVETQKQKEYDKETGRWE